MRTKEIPLEAAAPMAFAAEEVPAVSAAEVLAAGVLGSSGTLGGPMAPLDLVAPRAVAAVVAAFVAAVVAAVAAILGAQRPRRSRLP